MNVSSTRDENLHTCSIMKNDRITIDSATRATRANTVAQQYNGIHPLFEDFYIHSIVYSAERAVAAFQQFEDGAAGSSTPAVVVRSVQESLAHAAAVSRFFWPMKDHPLAVARGKRLREAFQLDDSSPLKWRKLRNAFEHFDESLDQFLLCDPTGYFFPGAIVGSHSLADDAVGNIFKLVDPIDDYCVILGEKFEFRRIIAAVASVLMQAQTMERQGCGLGL